MKSVTLVTLQVVERQHAGDFDCAEHQGGSILGRGAGERLNLSEQWIDEIRGQALELGVARSAARLLGRRTRAAAGRRRAGSRRQELRGLQVGLAGARVDKTTLLGGSRRGAIGSTGTSAVTPRPLAPFGSGVRATPRCRRRPRRRLGPARPKVQ